MVLPSLCAALVLALPLVGAADMKRAPEVQARDSAPWTLQGCYTDMSSSRTLAAASFVNTSMTVELCIAFCSTGGFNLAGVEFGKECYCDHALQSTGTMASSQTCSEPCSGNSTESCGAGNFLDVYWNGAPSPTIPQVVGTWKYEGCFADSITSRVLPNPQTISRGVTVESCTAACKANGFSVAGLEFSQECWCGSSLPTSLLSDSDCQTTCKANTTEFCGGSSKLTVYEDTTGQICLSTTHSAEFNLAAVYRTPPTTGPASVPLHLSIIQTVTLVSWSILTTKNDVLFTSEVMTSGGLLPKSTSQPNFRTASLAVVTGDSPIFVTTQFPPTAVGPYCTMSNPVPGPNAPPVLAAHGASNLWALCPNSTAAGRVDVVFSPIDNHPHYTKASCKAVYITVNDV